MGDSKRVTLEIELKDGKLVARELEKARDAIKETPAHVDRLDKALAAAKKAAVALAAAFSAREMWKILTETENAVVQLDASLRALGKYTPTVSNHFRQLAADLQKVSRYDAETLLPLFSRMLSLGRIRGDQMGRVMQDAMDLAVVTGNLEGAVTLLTKASAGSTSELKRYGIVIDDSIPAGQRFEAVLRLIEERMGGMEEQMSKTASGAVEQLKNSLGDLLEEVLVPMAPVIASLARNLKDFLNAGGETEQIRLINKLQEQLVTAEAQMKRFKDAGDFAPSKYKPGLVRTLLGMETPVDSAGYVIDKEAQAALAPWQKAREENLAKLQREIDSIKAAIKTQLELYYKDTYGKNNFGDEPPGDGASLPTSFMGAWSPYLRFPEFYGEKEKKFRAMQRAGQMSRSGLSISEIPSNLLNMEEPDSGLGDAADATRDKYLMLGDTISTMFADIASGASSAGEAIKRALLGALSQLALKKGEFWILEGWAQMASGNPGGGVMVAKGIAMMALGGGLAGFAASGGRGGGSVGGGGGGGTPYRTNGTTGSTKIIIIGQNARTYDGGQNLGRALTNAGLDRSFQRQVIEAIKENNRGGVNVADL